VSPDSVDYRVEPAKSQHVARPLLDVIEDIASAEGVDGLYLGQFDLSVFIGESRTGCQASALALTTTLYCSHNGQSVTFA
jgi:hypothetical protein